MNYQKSLYNSVYGILNNINMFSTTITESPRDLLIINNKNILDNQSIVTENGDVIIRVFKYNYSLIQMHSDINVYNLLDPEKTDKNKIILSIQSANKPEDEWVIYFNPIVLFQDVVAYFNSKIAGKAKGLVLCPDNGSLDNSWYHVSHTEKYYQQKSDKITAMNPFHVDNSYYSPLNNPSSTSKSSGLGFTFGDTSTSPDPTSTVNYVWTNSENSNLPKNSIQEKQKMEKVILSEIELSKGDCKRILEIIENMQKTEDQVKEENISIFKELFKEVDDEENIS